MKDQVKSEAKQAKAVAKAQAKPKATAKAKQNVDYKCVSKKVVAPKAVIKQKGCIIDRETTPTETLMECLNKIDIDMNKLSKQMKKDTVTTALPTVSLSVSELDELSQQMAHELKLVDTSHVIHELASSMRTRDYINHIEAKVQK